jgi:hypothetical protein
LLNSYGIAFNGGAFSREKAPHFHFTIGQQICQEENLKNFAQKIILKFVQNLVKKSLHFFRLWYNIIIEREKEV